MYYCYYETPIGELLLAGDGDALAMIGFPKGSMRRDPEPDWIYNEKRLASACRQLGEYFAGQRKEFDLPLRFDGTPFQNSVWHALRDIPYGETTSYGALAAKLGNAGASRAVGAANGANPLPIVAPCHRVIGADSSLTGFGGGTYVKHFLLTHENARGYQGRLF